MAQRKLNQSGEGGTTFITWIALFIAIAALVIGWAAYNRAGEDLENQASDTASEVIDEGEQAAEEAAEDVDEGPDNVDEDSTTTDDVQNDANPGANSQTQ